MTGQYGLFIRGLIRKMLNQNKLRKLEEKKRELLRNIQLCEASKKKIIDFVQELNNQYDEGLISYEVYSEKLKEALKQRTIEQWIKYYDEYIEYCRCHLENCINKISEEKKKNKSASILAILAILVILGLSLFFLRPVLTGLVVGEESYTQNLGLIINESSSYELQLEHIGVLKSAKISGSLLGDGNVKVYLEDKLILDNSELEESRIKKITGLIVGGLTGWFVDDADIAENETIETLENEIIETLENETIETLENETIETLENETIETLENETIETLENETTETLENETIIESENETSEEIDETIEGETAETGTQDVREISFEDICIETCSLELNKTSYELRFEIDGAVLELDSIKYVIASSEEQEDVDVSAEKLIQGPAEINKPVKWFKNISLDEEKSNLTIVIPKDISNLKVRKVTGEIREEISEDKLKISEIKRKKSLRENLITWHVIRGVEEDEKEVELIIEDNVMEVEIEFETEAPRLFEEDLTNKKSIIISGHDDLHYENVLAYTNLSKEVSEGKIKLYRTTEGIKEQTEFTAYDKNDNGLIDYIEWVVPYLSNQTYELIIKISDAEHLDENKTFISNIYDEVKELDGVWSEAINDSEYIRITFSRNLTSNRDIAIYPRVVSGTPRIEVYEINGTELIAEFSLLNENEYNKVYLTNLISESQNKFDLKVLDGEIEIDYIVDAPTRFYLPSSGDAPVSVTDDAKWDGLADGFDSYPTFIEKQSSAMTTISLNGNSDTGDTDYIYGQWVSEPIAAQTISAQTLELQIRGMEENARCNQVVSVSIRVVSGDGSTVRGTLASGRDATELYVSTTTLENRRYTVTTNEVTANDGDRIVIEIGTGGNPATGAGGNSHDADLRIGDTSASDLPEDDSSTSDYCPWVEFPDGILFGSDETAPTYSLNQTNNTEVGESTLFSLYVNDNSALNPKGQYIFSTNNTGVWENESAVNFTATPQWANVTKTLNSTEGISIGYRWYIDDNEGNPNNTGIYTLTTTERGYGTLSVNLTTPSDNYEVSQNNTFPFNVTVTCVGEEGAVCGAASIFARYNASSSSPDTDINTTQGASPFYAVGGGDGESSTIDSYSEINQEGYYTLYDLDCYDGGDFKSVGQSFTGNGKTINSVKFYLKKIGSSSYPLTAHIHSHSGTYGTSSVPTYSRLATSNSVSSSSITDSFQLVEFTFDSPIEAVNGTHYVIYLYASPFCAEGEELHVGLDNSSSTHDGNAWYDSPYTADSSKDLIFYVMEGGGSYTYHFDASDGGPYDPDSAWTNDENAFDGNLSTYASCSSAASLYGNGTNAPIEGDEIEQVRARFYGYADMVYLYVNIYSGDELLYSEWTDWMFDQFNNYVPLDVPTGGWTWQKINDLRTEIIDMYSGGVSINLIEVNVITAGAAENPLTTPELSAGESYQANWTINATGTNNTQWELGAFINSSYGNALVPNNWTSNSTVCIGTCEGGGDTTYPQIEFVPPTLDNDETTTNTSVTANVSITEENLDEFVWNWNGTNFTIFNDSLVLMMNFDNVSALGENDTYIVDVSGYENNGTIINSGIDWSSDGKYNGGFEFDSSDNDGRIEIPYSADFEFDNSSSISVFLWFKKDTPCEAYGTGTNEVMMTFFGDDHTDDTWWFGCMANSSVEEDDRNKLNFDFYPGAGHHIIYIQMYKLMIVNGIMVGGCMMEQQAILVCIWMEN
jgi:hypothetical protein